MPKRKRVYRKRRRTFKKRRRRRRRSSGFSKSSSLPIGKTFCFRTRYVENSVTYTAAAGAPALQVYSLNNLTDPNVTGIGQQPIGFDQLMPMYDHYVVIGAKAKISVANMDSLAQGQLTCYIKDSASPDTDLNKVIENGLCKTAQIGTAGSSAGTKVFTMKCNTSKFFGNKVFGENKYQGNISSGPGDQVYLVIDWRQVQGLASISAAINVEIEYVAILTEPKQLARS